MKEILRQIVFLAVAAALSWWLFLVPRSGSESPRTPPAESLRIGLTPILQERAREERPAPLASAQHAPLVRAPMQPVPVQPPQIDSSPPPEPVRTPEPVPTESAPPEQQTPPEPAEQTPPPAELGAPEGSQSTGAPEVPKVIDKSPVATSQSPATSQDAPRAGSDPRSTQPAEHAQDHVASEPSPVRPETPGPLPRTESDPVVQKPAPVPTPAAHPAPEPQAANERPASSAAGSPAARSSTRSAEDLMADAELLATASKEVAEEVRRGFVTVMLAAPEDQLEIARFFGEELVLVPRRVLDAGTERPAYFHIASDGPPVVDRVASRPALERFRQYRDLFDYEYGRLPEPLRELRRSVLSRSEIYLFAALIPAREWALVVGRRSELLARAGRDLSQVRRFVVRYVRRPGGGFDLRAEEIVFADGKRFQPQAEPDPAIVR